MEVAKKPWAVGYEEPDSQETTVQSEAQDEAPPEGSILQDIKTMLSSIPFEMKAFDQELILHINSAIFYLFSMGTKWTKSPVVDYSQTWSDLFGDHPEIHSIKEYVFLKVKLVFDTPGTSYIINSFQARADELAWRIKTYSEGGYGDAEDSGGDTAGTNDQTRRRADALRKKRHEMVSTHFRKGTKANL